MNRKLIVMALVLAVLGTAGVWAARTVQDYSKTVNDFKQSKDVAPFFDSAYAYAVFPKIGKGGLGVGASHGKGQVYKGGKVTGFTALTNVSIGFQAGGEAYSQVVFFEDERAYSDFTSGNFEFGAQAQAVVIQSGATASAGSEGAAAGASSGGSGGSQATRHYHKGFLVFIIQKGGLMYEASLAGQKYSYKPVE